MPTDEKLSLYQKIGKDFIEQAITEFYKRAFEDPIIGHFFFQKNREELTAKQIPFAAMMLGSDEHRYQGKPLRHAHQGLGIRRPHFDRRQVLMRDVLEEMKLKPELIDDWLKLENNLRGMIL